MHYLSIAEGRAASGLRLVLTQGVPGPWGESAKAIFDCKGITYQAIAQEGGGDNTELVAWTSQASAPVAILDDELPRSDSLEILILAERLAPTPRLIPENIAERVTTFGLIREIIGRDGLGWRRRLMMLAPLMESAHPPEAIVHLAKRYGYAPELVTAAPAAIARILEHLAATLREQQQRGNHYLVGDTLSAVDIYWACFSNMLSPLPPEQCPMPGFIRKSWSEPSPVIAAALDPALIAHRDAVFANHLRLPMDFLPQS